ncbi:hypothetical protein V5F59_09935 [Xanthobacter autotrophicus DSM 431]|uniref:hypothetical protein n=1 Tax=Xanthobacter nonsaccharivorans TaxID=3119912 RepID=UPI003728A7FE
MMRAAPLLTGLRLAPLALLLLAGGLPAMARDADTRTPAGYIVGMELPATNPDVAAHVQREGQEMPVQIGGALFDGDKVVVRDAGAVVTIETVNDRHLRVDAARSPHLVTGALPSGGRFSALAAMIGELFESKPAARTVNLIGRNDETLRLQMGRSVPQRVVPGTRLWLGWQGGEAPFTVEIRTPGKGGVLLSAVPATGRSATLALPPEASGPLVLAVRDGAGEEVQVELLVNAEAPPVPAWVSEGAPTPAFGQVAGALWLLERNPAEWDLQAAALAAEAGHYAAAEELLRRLAEGRKPRR